MGIMEYWKNCCKHENYIRKLIEFTEQERKLNILPVNSQINFCIDCWQVVWQEDNEDRKRIYIESLLDENK